MVAMHPAHATWTSKPGASILGGLGEQSPTFLTVGVDRFGHVNQFVALGSLHSCVKNEVCSLCRMWGLISHP